MTRHPAMLTVRETAARCKCSVEVIYKRLKLRRITGAVKDPKTRQYLIPARWNYKARRAGNPNFGKRFGNGRKQH